MTSQSPATGATPPALTVQQHVGRTARLAWPIMLSRVGMVVMVAVDTIMAGWVGAEQLAFYGIAAAPQSMFLVVGIGLLVGTMVLCSQADGAGRPQDTGPIWHRSMIVAGVLGVIAGGVFMTGEALLVALGQGAEIAAGGGPVLVAFGVATPATLFYIATNFFLEGIGRPTPGMAVSLAFNVVNAVLNWLVIFDHVDFPTGALGVAWTTTIVRWLMLLTLVVYVFAMAGGARYGVRDWRSAADGLTRKLVKLGIPLGLTTGSEAFAFAGMSIFAGWIGVTQLAAYQASVNLLTLLFMLSIGLSTATAVRVGNAVGRHDRPGMATAGWVGIGLGAILTLTGMAALLVFAEPVARLYTVDPTVLAILVPGMALVAVAVVADGMQAIVMGALRGMADVKVATGVYIFCFPLFSAPLGYYWGVQLDWGLAGLLWALLLGLSLTLLLLLIRFQILARRGVQPY